MISDRPQSLDSTRDYLLTLGHPAGGSLEGAFDGEEEFVGQIWTGDDQAVLALATAAWDTDLAGNPASLSNPVVKLTVAAASIEDLTPGTYHIRVRIPATDIEVWRDQIEFVAAPASGTAAAVYCTFDDCLSYADWLPRLIASSSHLQTNLAEQRALARKWLNETIIGRASRDVTTQYSRHAPVNAATALDITTGVDAGYDWGPSIYPEPSIMAQVDTIRALLANTSTTYLMTSDGNAARICAHYAIYLACDSQLPAGEGETDYQKFGRRHLGLATMFLAGYTARIDDDADGTADYELTP